MKIVSGHAPYGDGGLGRALQSIVEDARSDGVLLRYFCSRARPNDATGCAVDLSRYRWLTRGLLRRAWPGWRDFAVRELFDRHVARSLGRGDGLAGVEVVALDGVALHTFAAGRARGAATLTLAVNTSHVDNVVRQHRRSAGSRAVEPSWVTPLHVRKLRREYAAADRITVPSQYAWSAFVAAGVPEAKLVRRVEPVPPRFAPPDRRPASDVFTLIYVGRLEQTKGIVVLLDAFGRLTRADVRLVLVGRFATAAFERFVADRQRRDPRISIAPGDPLPRLHQADLFVHPSFEDALALAPLEALAAGVPVVVTEDTGMKEYVEPGRNGLVVPTGDVDALTDLLKDLIEHPVAPSGLRSLLPSGLQALA